MLVQAKRQGIAAYEAFLDGIKSGSKARNLPRATSGNEDGDNEIDNLLSELDMDLTSFGAPTQHSSASGGNQARNTSI